ncbi:UNVERIFIED_CONTAM: hypothetical protein HHA_451370 [Hammondia hammondi]|eukprot:XP_008884188.1 hypothetical protein HHA_451370 [Hammondia hammondi]
MVLHIDPDGCTENSSWIRLLTKNQKGRFCVQVMMMVGGAFLRRLLLCEYSLVL